MTPEGEVLRAVLDYLAVRHVLAFRMNTGAVASEYKGKKRFMRFGTPGMADVLAFPVRRRDWFDTPSGVDYKHDCIIPFWLEVKAEKGRQSPLQKKFQALVEARGHRYRIVRSIEDVQEALR